MSRDYGKIFLHVFVPIGCGVAIYAFWRGLYLIDQTEERFPLFDSSHAYDWIKYNLPDALWLYALLSTLYFIWDSKSFRQFLSWSLLAITASFLSEALQACHFIRGTYDWNDLAAYGIAIFFFLFNFQQSFKITSK